MSRFSRVRVVGLGVLVLAGAVWLTLLGPGSAAPARAIHLSTGRRLSHPHGATARIGRTPIRTPSSFAAVRSASGYQWDLELRSAATGRVLKSLGDLGGAWTNNGFAFSPDGRYIYFTLIGNSPKWQGLRLARIAVSTRRRRFIAYGEQPTISPGGRQMAYVAGGASSATIAIRDIASGRVRSIDVSHLLRHRHDLLNASLAWFGDGTKLAVVEECCATLAVANVGSGSPPPSASDVLRLIVVSVPPQGRLSARRVRSPGLRQMPESMGPDATRPNSIILGSTIRDRALVDRLTIGGSQATLSRVLTIAHSQVLGFNPTGRRVIYLIGHNPPHLWTATIGGHRLTHAHLLIKNSRLVALSW